MARTKTEFFPDLEPVTQTTKTPISKKEFIDSKLRKIVKYSRVLENQLSKLDTSFSVSLNSSIIYIFQTILNDILSLKSLVFNYKDELLTAELELIDNILTKSYEHYQELRVNSAHTANILRLIEVNKDYLEIVVDTELKPIEATIVEYALSQDDSAIEKFISYTAFEIENYNHASSIDGIFQEGFLEKAQEKLKILFASNQQIIFSTFKKFQENIEVKLARSLAATEKSKIVKRKLPQIRAEFQLKLELLLNLHILVKVNEQGKLGFADKSFYNLQYQAIIEAIKQIRDNNFDPNITDLINNELKFYVKARNDLAHSKNIFISRKIDLKTLEQKIIDILDLAEIYEEIKEAVSPYFAAGSAIASLPAAAEAEIESDEEESANFETLRPLASKQIVGNKLKIRDSSLEDQASIEEAINENILSYLRVIGLSTEIIENQLKLESVAKINKKTLKKMQEKHDLYLDSFKLLAELINEGILNINSTIYIDGNNNIALTKKAGYSPNSLLEYITSNLPSPLKIGELFFTHVNREELDNINSFWFFVRQVFKLFNTFMKEPETALKYIDELLATIHNYTPNLFNLKLEYSELFYERSLAPSLLANFNLDYKLNVFLFILEDYDSNKSMVIDESLSATKKSYSERRVKLMPNLIKTFFKYIDVNDEFFLKNSNEAYDCLTEIMELQLYDLVDALLENGYRKENLNSRLKNPYLTDESGQELKIKYDFFSFLVEHHSETSLKILTYYGDLNILTNSTFFKILQTYFEHKKKPASEIIELNSTLEDMELLAFLCDSKFNKDLLMTSLSIILRNLLARSEIPKSQAVGRLIHALKDKYKDCPESEKPKILEKCDIGEIARNMDLTPTKEACSWLKYIGSDFEFLDLAEINRIAEIVPTTDEEFYACTKPPSKTQTDYEREISGYFKDASTATEATTGEGSSLEIMSSPAAGGGAAATIAAHDTRGEVNGSAASFAGEEGLFSDSGSEW